MKTRKKREISKRGKMAAGRCSAAAALLPSNIPRQTKKKLSRCVSSGTFALSHGTYRPSLASRFSAEHYCICRYNKGKNDINFNIRCTMHFLFLVLLLHCSVAMAVRSFGRGYDGSVWYVRTGGQNLQCERIRSTPFPRTCAECVCMMTSRIETALVARRRSSRTRLQMLPTILE